MSLHSLSFVSLLQEFAVLDSTGTGKLPKSEVRALLELQLERKTTDLEFQAFLRLLTLDKEGLMHLHDYVAAVLASKYFTVEVLNNE